MRMNVKFVPKGILISNLINQISMGFKLGLLDNQTTPIISLSRGKGKEKSYYYFQVSVLQKIDNSVLNVRTPIYFSQTNDESDKEKARQAYSEAVSHPSELIKRVFDMFRHYGIKDVYIRSSKSQLVAPEFKTIVL